MRVVCVSDTHGLHEEALAVPPGDVFVHAGDFTDTGARDEVLAFNAFLGRLPHRYKLVIAGNHESTFDRAFYPRNWHHYGHRQQYDPDEVRALLTNALYLEDQAVLVEGFKFYGTPWQPEFCNWAFNLPRGPALLDKWRRIPGDTDVLVSHTPPFGRGDQVGRANVGCEDLLREVQTRVKPSLHVFGHVHEGYGRSSDGVTTFVNASACTHDYAPVNPPFVFDLDAPRSQARGRDAADESGDDKAIDYARLLHEQLRVCSQKPAFVDLPAPPNGYVRVGGEPLDGKPLDGKPLDGKPLDGKPLDGKPPPLSAFRVEGTAADLLFESTLRVRPVQHSQVRALRYLFSQGFRSNSANYDDAQGVHDAASPDATQHAVAADGGDKGQRDKPEPHGDVGEADGADRSRQRRRQLAIARRVTVAVLNDLSESTEMTGPNRDHLEQASIASESLIDEAAGHNGAAASGEAAGAPAASSARRRRDKTLRKRDGFIKLSTLVEEPAGAPTDGLSSPEAKAAKQSVTASSLASTTVTVAVTAAESAPPPASEPAEEDCVLCKYNVPGHVHPGRTAPPPLAAEVQALAIVAASATSPKEKPGGDSRSVSASKRLSSWF